MFSKNAFCITVTASTASTAAQSPPTLEGWYTLHERWQLDAGLWWHLEPADRRRYADSLADWIDAARGADGEGDAGAWLQLGQKGDLQVLIYRRTLEALHAVQASFRRADFFGFFKPAGAYLAVVEAGLYEAVAIAEQRVRLTGLQAGTAEYLAAVERETAIHRELLTERVMKPIPPRRYLCSYPMNKRRGEQFNWYATTLDERRGLMRGHGRIGHRFAGQVDQVVQGSVGLDDWEWLVDLHADDPLVFKKLVTEMRYDPASSRFADFGGFHIGLRATRESLVAWLSPV